MPANTDVELLYARERAARKKVVAIRGTGYNAAVDMSSDALAVKAVKKLQDVTRKLLQTKWTKYTTTGGKDDLKGTVFRVKADVTFPKNMPDEAEKGTAASFVLETAPIELMPHSILNFLEMVTADAKVLPYFWLNAPHILMIGFDDDVHHEKGGQAFQEYTDKFSHEPFTVGFGGRPGGPATYISKMDNSIAHGPGSQGSTMNEADSCFARIFEGQDTVERLMNVWGKAEHGFNVNDQGEVVARQEYVPVTFSLCKKGKC